MGKKVFFSASTYAVPERLDSYLAIISGVKKAGGSVIIDWTKDWVEIARKYKKLGRDRVTEQDTARIIDRDKLYGEHMWAMEKCDCVIAEVTRPTIFVGYQLFHAILNKKPVLALYDADARDVDWLKIKAIIPTESPLVTFKKYRAKSLSNIIGNYLHKKADSLIKFNFVISKEIDNYINWLVRNNPDKSKSELLREKIADEIILNDDLYQRYLNSPN